MSGARSLPLPESIGFSRSSVLLAALWAPDIPPKPLSVSHRCVTTGRGRGPTPQLQQLNPGLRAWDENGASGGGGGNGTAVVVGTEPVLQPAGNRLTAAVP